MLLVGVAWDAAGHHYRTAADDVPGSAATDRYPGAGKAHGYLTAGMTTLCGRDVRTLAWTPFIGHAFDHVQNDLQCAECIAELAPAGAQ